MIFGLQLFRATGGQSLSPFDGLNHIEDGRMWLTGHKPPPWN